MRPWRVMFRFPKDQPFVDRSFGTKERADAHAAKMRIIYLPEVEIWVEKREPAA